MKMLEEINYNRLKAAFFNLQSAIQCEPLANFMLLSVVK